MILEKVACTHNCITTTLTGVSEFEGSGETRSGVPRGEAIRAKLPSIKD